VALVDVANRDEALRALDGILADADEYAAGERNFQLAGFLGHVNTQARLFIGRPLMHAAARAQSRRNILEHQTHAGVERAQHRHLVARH
jgi:hypothetical protein